MSAPGNHERAPSHLVGIDAGRNESSDDFSRRYELEDEADFDLDCVAACWNFLTRQRQYTHAEGNTNRVKFGRNVQNWTDCYLSMGRSHGQFQTGEDLNQGTMATRVVAGGMTYQLYTHGEQPNTISVGVPVRARLESIAVNARDFREARVISINGSTLNYHNAALLELQRMQQNLPSLKGRCEHRTPEQQPKSGIDDITKGLKDVTVQDQD